MNNLLGEENDLTFDNIQAGVNKKALEIARGMGAWVYARLKKLPMETRIRMWNRYITGEYSGMNEVLARLYRITGDPNTLRFSINGVAFKPFYETYGRYSVYLQVILK